MPRETVYDQATLYDVEIGWSSDSVQIGIQSHDREPLVKHLAQDAADPAMFTSLWGNLDRAGCNRMIKLLRRARDEAFGRDE